MQIVGFDRAEQHHYAVERLAQFGTTLLILLARNPIGKERSEKENQ
jgi:hypothetical protein